MKTANSPDFGGFYASGGVYNEKILPLKFSNLLKKISNLYFGPLRCT